MGAFAAVPFPLWTADPFAPSLPPWLLRLSPADFPADLFPALIRHPGSLAAASVVPPCVRLNAVAPAAGSLGEAQAPEEAYAAAPFLGVREEEAVVQRPIPKARVPAL